MFMLNLITLPVNIFQVLALAGHALGAFHRWTLSPHQSLWSEAIVILDEEAKRWSASLKVKRQNVSTRLGRMPGTQEELKPIHPFYCHRSSWTHGQKKNCYLPMISHSYEGCGLPWPGETTAPSLLPFDLCYFLHTNTQIHIHTYPTNMLHTHTPHMLCTPFTHHMLYTRTHSTPHIHMLCTYNMHTHAIHTPHTLYIRTTHTCYTHVPHT